ncbi:hypothetical protein [Enterococcus sp. CSURQ0835]|uniref:hypothetical protein n=1 Tax=Enterococcus sp. CSURQ0835 TaxID=2681394 RepID=UPI00135917DE|nr:hypothetical protein [Enterococcus sp. CSURQ0835]
MAKKYYAPTTKTWHSWRFLKLRQNDPKYRAAYLAAAKQRKRRRGFQLLLGIPLVAIVIFFSLVAIGTMGEEKEPPTSVVPSVSTESESSTSTTSRSMSPASSPATTYYSESVVQPVPQPAPASTPSSTYSTDAPPISNSEASRTPQPSTATSAPLPVDPPATSSTVPAETPASSAPVEQPEN